jgi:2'-5' RNA ligase
MEPERRRLFVGVPLAEDLVGFVNEAQAALPVRSDTRLMRRDQLHVTLCFLGELGGEAAERAARVLSGVPCTMGGVVSLGGYVCLPSAARARVVALAIEDGEGILTALFERVASGLEREGLFQREARAFRPHLTIARLRRPGKLGLSADMPTAAFEVRSVCLYESVLSREGARYKMLQAVEFDIQ